MTTDLEQRIDRRLATYIDAVIDDQVDELRPLMARARAEGRTNVTVTIQPPNCDHGRWIAHFHWDVFDDDGFPFRALTIAGSFVGVHLAGPVGALEGFYLPDEILDDDLGPTPIPLPTWPPQ